MKNYFILPLFILFLTISFSQKKKKSNNNITSSQISDLEFRSVGPAFMSGRIADIAINPHNENEWYVAVGSGGVWKTINSGTTWISLSDDESFYSTGSITIDPSNPSKIWLGTGENVGGRHVGIGDGVYLSTNGGKSWNNMGLKKSEHISKIIVHPNNSNIVYVASQGPLWSSGGDRGLFKSVDGGKSWKNILNINKWTGVTDIVVNHQNPDIMYAATWQRHRNVAAYMGGGPGTAIYKSENGGDDWQKLSSGLPWDDSDEDEVNPMSSPGKIGLAISPFNHDILYAAIELDRRKGAVYKSTNAGGSWKKMSNTVSGATGPHYYQELVASPHVFDKIYLMDIKVQVSENGGKDFYIMNESDKHVDNHSLTFKISDPNYLLIGTDGGVYESFDDTKSWKFIANLPLTQFYKLAVDDAKPFYNIFGGTQDNNTQGGPSRTLKSEGITNSDWYVLLGGDGHQPATEPGNPNIVYAQSQQGNIYRIDRTNGERTFIKPQNNIDEPYERFNWDSPILVSSHDVKRIYFGSQRLWKSENRGDSWTAISPDLTLDQERLGLPIMGKKQSWDNAWDVYAMSTYNTITSISESPLNDKIIFIGTDDGLIQFTNDGGLSWNKVNVEKLPGVPKGSFVNDIKTDLFDANTAYVVLDNHKFGDYKPYIYKTIDAGQSWFSISSGLPNNYICWRIVQDHIDPNLLFLGTEYGVYTSLNGGISWIKFSSGIPTISIRDLAIQKRENDLVAATFGRGFYVLDDYSPLRFLNYESLKSNIVFSPKDALQYTPISSGSTSQGSNKFYSKNPPYGAVLTYYISETKKSLRDKRINSENQLNSLNKDIPFPGWDKLDDELNEIKPKIFIEIRDSENNLIDKFNGTYNTGFNRVSWDLTQNLSVKKIAGYKGYDLSLKINVPEGKYSYNVFTLDGNNVSKIGSKFFNVKKIKESYLKNPIKDSDVNDFYNDIISTVNNFKLHNHKFNNLKEGIELLVAIMNSPSYDNNDKKHKEYVELTDLVNKAETFLNGNKSKKDIREKDFLTISDRISVAVRGVNSSYGFTHMHKESLNKAKLLIADFANKIESINRKYNSFKINSFSEEIIDYVD